MKDIFHVNVRYKHVVLQLHDHKMVLKCINYVIVSLCNGRRAKRWSKSVNSAKGGVRREEGEIH